MTEEMRQPLSLIKCIICHFVKDLTCCKSDEPWKTEENRRDTIVDGEGVDSTILGVETKYSTIGVDGFIVAIV